MNWRELIMIPPMLLVLMIYFPIMEVFTSELFPILDAADPQYVFFIGLIKLMIGILPLVIIFAFLWKIVKALTTDSTYRQPGY